MIVLADNDILIKLAACDLFDDFLTAYEVSPADIRILKLARHSIGSRKHRRRIGEEGYQRLVVFLDAVADILLEPDPAHIAALNKQTDKNIDAGEAALFALCPHMPGSVIVTGDKKSLAGLTLAAETDGVCATMYQNLAGRVFCFEQIVTRILDRVGFEAIRDRLIAGRDCDRGLTFWLGSELDADEPRFREGLRSYLDQARATSGTLLATD